MKNLNQQILKFDYEQNFKDDLTKAVDDEVDRIYRLGYNSIGRDQTEYMKAQSNLINGVKDLQSGLAIFDEEGKEYQKIVNSGQALTKISNTPNLCVLDTSSSKVFILAVILSKPWITNLFPSIH